MNLLKQGYQQMPKLNKTKQLQNPYHSQSTSTCSEMSRLFYLNDRSKIQLNEDSSNSSDEQKSTYIKQTLKNKVEKHVNILQNNNVNIKKQTIELKSNSLENKSAVSWQHDTNCFDSQYKNRHYLGENSAFVYNKQIKKHQTPQFGKQNQNVIKNKQHFENQSILPQNKSERPQQFEFTEQYYTKHKIYIKKSINIENKQTNMEKVEDYSRTTKPSQQFGKQHHVYPQEVIAQEQNIDELIKASKNNQKHFHSSISQSYKPSLDEASRIIENQENKQESNQKRRGSIIDRIKQQGFAQSQVFSQKQEIKSNYDGLQFNKQTKHINKKQMPFTLQFDFSRNNKTSNLMSGQNQKIKKRRVKIFENRKTEITTPIKNEKQQDTRYIDSLNKQNNQTIPFSTMNKHTTEKKSMNNLNETKQKHQPSEFISRTYENNNNNVGYNICPHTQCILKSLQIIDKLTDSPCKDCTNKKSAHKNDFEKGKDKQNLTKQKIQQQIGGKSLQISLQIDNFIAELTLQDLLLDQTTTKVKKFRIELQNVLSKIRDLNENYASTNISRYQLTSQLNRMLKVLHYISITQERYRMWQARLFHLSQRIGDILKAEKMEQSKKLTDIAQHISQLEISRFYGPQVKDIGILQAYNQFVQKQINQLNETVQCVKAIIISKNKTK